MADFCNFFLLMGVGQVGGGAKPPTEGQMLLMPPLGAATAFWLYFHGELKHEKENPKMMVKIFCVI